MAMKSKFTTEELVIFLRLMEHELDKCDPEYLEDNFESLMEKVKNELETSNNN